MVDLNGLEDYLVFRVGPDLYLTRLMDVQEIVEPLPMRRVPRTVDSFVGMANLRSEIVSVIDFRILFGVERPSGETQEKLFSTELFMIFKHELSLIGALVDEVLRVQSFSEKDIEKNTSIPTRVPPEYLKGFLKIDDSIIPILDLPRVLSREQWIQVGEAA